MQRGGALKSFGGVLTSLRTVPGTTGLLFSLISVLSYYNSVKKCNSSYKIKWCRYCLVIQN